MDNIFNEWIRVIKCRDKEFNGRRKGGEGGIRGGKELGGGIRRRLFSCYGREPRGAVRLVCSD